ncbi:ROK family protein [Agromyces mediolanus]|uniref:ROK family protein n=1 Tax=Agromyces mediolanus TaxID=41986 RepID=UPI0038377C99
MTEAVLALDVGGTKAHGALLDREYRVLDEGLAATAGRDPGLVATLGLAGELLDRARGAGTTVSAVVAGFPEYVSNDGLVTAHEVLDWTVQPGEALAELAGGVPVRIASDVKAGALGELALGRGREHDGFVYVSLGTGISTAIVVDRRLHEGARGEAIGFGEWSVPADLDPEWRGNLEGFASGSGIAARYLARTGTELADRGARGVLAAAESGDATAVAVVDSAAAAIGRALAQLVSLLDPPALVLAGGLGSADTRLGRGIRAEYERVAARRPSPPPLLPSAVPTNPGLLGAAALAWELAAAPHAVGTASREERTA